MTASEFLSVIVFGVIGFLAVRFLLRSKTDDKKDEAKADQRNEAPVREKPATWHEVLEVTPTATPDEIKNAYHRQMQKYHPDKVSSLGAELQSVALKKTQEITAAYQQAMRRF